MLRTFHHAQFDVRRLVAQKAARRVSVCLPARNEESTVARIVTAARRLADAGLVDEVLVVDDHSTDATCAVAAAAGARVVPAADILPEYGDGHGKGEALWKSLHESSGDLVVWCDADVSDFTEQFVIGLVGPLLEFGDVAFVKGFYRRLGGDGSDRGGRVTELVARPLLALLFPHLTPVVQPLAGEYAARRDVLEQLPFVQGYGVDVGLLVDVAERYGTDAIAQVDLGVRTHRNRPLDELSPQALAVAATLLGRAAPGLVKDHATIVRPGLDPLDVEVTERPPLVSVPAYRRRTA